jgi:DsbC/DsbD-like thiol-disulfide interchange protein
MKLCLTFLLAASCSAGPIAEPSTTPASDPVTHTVVEKPATARLVSDVRSVRPGDTFRIGVLLEMQPGWHIYWKNPGEAGLPTSVNFGAPEGVEVGMLQWPTPKKFSQPGDILGYGYEGDALFSAQVRTSNALKPGTEITISANVGWLCCERVCIPGKADLSLKLPVRDHVEPGDVSLFESWKPKVPVDANHGVALAEIQVTGDLKRNAGNPAPFEIDVTWKDRATSIEWFPAPGDAVDISDVAVRSEGAYTTIAFGVGVLDGVGKPPDSFESIVAFTDASGARRALRVLVPLRRT